MQNLLHKTSRYRDSSGSRPLNDGTLVRRVTRIVGQAMPDHNL